MTRTSSRQPSPSRSVFRARSSRAALVAFALASAGSVAVPSRAYADTTPAAVDEGRAHFQKGVGYFRVGDFRAALAEFTRANAVAPSFRIQFNIGQTCAELQDHVCAAKAFDAFLTEGGKQVPSNQRAVAERELKRLHTLVGTVRIVVNVSGADVTVDGIAVGTSPLPEGGVMVAAGKRKIAAKKDSLGSTTATVTAVAGETVDASLVLAEGTAAGEPTSGDGTPSRTPFWIGLSVTGALTIATVAFGVSSLGAKSDLDDAASRFGVSTAQLDDARAKVDTLAIVTDVFAGATVIAAGVTTYLFFKTRPPKTTVGVAPGGFVLRHTF